MITPGSDIRTSGSSTLFVMKSFLALWNLRVPGYVTLGPKVVSHLEAMSVLGLGECGVGALCGAAVRRVEGLTGRIHVLLYMGEGNVDLHSGSHQVALRPEHLQVLHSKEPVPEVLDPGLVSWIQFFGDTETMEVEDGSAVSHNDLPVLNLFWQLPVSCSLQDQPQLSAIVLAANHGPLGLEAQAELLYHSLRASILSLSAASRPFSNNISGFSFWKSRIIALNMFREMLCFMATLFMVLLLTVGPLSLYCCQ